MSPHTNGLPKTVGDGSRLKFWQDRWCGETSLATSYPELSVDPYHTKLHPWPITNILQDIGRPSRSFEIFVLDCWPLYTPCLLGCPSLISIKLITYKKKIVCVSEWKYCNTWLEVIHPLNYGLSSSNLCLSLFCICSLVQTMDIQSWSGSFKYTTTLNYQACASSSP